VEDPTIDPGGIGAYDVYRSNTDLFSAHFGVSFMF